jgi:hypothetical protein
MKPTKANRLVELVRGKTLLKEAPTRRDVILHVYGNTPVVMGWKKLQKMSKEEANHHATAFFTNLKFGALLRSVRKAEYKALEKTGNLDSIHNNNNNNCPYHMVRDDSGVWRCVHIINEINGDYLLKHVKAQEKYVESMKRTAQKIMENASRSEEERDTLAREEFKRRFRRRFAKECTPKDIRKQVTELRQEKKLPQNKKDYRPNIKGINHLFIENASQVRQVIIDYELTSSYAKTYLNGDEIIASMLKEIILCDYHKKDYQLSEPKKPLGIIK